MKTSLFISDGWVHTVNLQLNASNQRQRVLQYLKARKMGKNKKIELVPVRLTEGDRRSNLRLIFSNREADGKVYDVIAVIEEIYQLLGGGRLEIYDFTLSGGFGFLNRDTRLNIPQNNEQSENEKKIS